MRRRPGLDDEESVAVLVVFVEAMREQMDLVPSSFPKQGTTPNFRIFCQSAMKVAFIHPDLGIGQLLV